MNPIHLITPLLIYLMAFATTYVLAKFAGIPKRDGRAETIDGLRGLLAIGVFIHHTAIWRQYSIHHIWESPTSNLYNHLGLSSVLLFFMITSFLFISKLLQSEHQTFTWRQFYIGRFLRLAPMYYCSFFIILLIVGIQTDWKLNDSYLELTKSIMHWLAFALHDTPDINQLNQTSIINAGVIWSLPYEWLFYCSLPLFAFMRFPAKSKLPVLFFAISFIAFFAWVHGFQYYPILAFVGGAIPALLNKYAHWNKPIQNGYASTIILGAAFLLLAFPNPYNIGSLCLLTVIFTLIAKGGDIFGLLKSPIVQFLGDISYSTYLLHGLLLYTFFHFALGIEKSAGLSINEYTASIVFLTPLLVLMSYLGFRYIESPFLKKRLK